jgi:hypothetical protein
MKTKIKAKTYVHELGTRWWFVTQSGTNPRVSYDLSGMGGQIPNAPTTETGHVFPPV